jgi:uncharacterized protein
VVAEENVEIVRAGLELFNGGEREALLELFDEDVEVYSSEELPNGGRFRGRAGYLEWVGAWLDAWEDFRVEALDYEPVDDRHVVVAMRQRGRGRLSGVEIAMDVFNLFELRDGRLVRFHLYPDRDSALAAVGAERA